MTTGEAILILAPLLAPMAQAYGYDKVTFGGALQWLSDAWARIAPPFGIAHGVALIVSVVVLLSVIELPLTLYRTFVVEAHHRPRVGRRHRPGRYRLTLDRDHVRRVREGAEPFGH